MVKDSRIDKKKANLAMELYLAVTLYRDEVLNYAEYMSLIQAIRDKYK